jgi:hypothetical protein
MFDEKESYPRYLRLNLLQPLDVVLSGGKKPHQLIIKAGTGLGPFAHAALVISPTWWFEADNYGVLTAPKLPTFVGRCDTDIIYLLEVPNHLRVFRHSALSNLTEIELYRLEQRLRFSPVRDQLEFREYPAWHRLADAADLPPSAKRAARFLLRMFNGRVPINPGSFCSELVAQVYADLGIQLMRDRRSASKVNPKALASESFLQPLAVIGDKPENFREDPLLLESMRRSFAYGLARETHGAKTVQRRAFVLFVKKELNEVSGKLDELVATISQNNARAGERWRL